MTAWIEVSHKWIDATPKGYFEDEYVWQGESDVAECTELKEEMALGQVITLGELRLRVIGRRFPYWLVVRDGWKAQVYQYLWPAKKWVQWVYCRLIITLAVWGLATYHPGRISSWKDIKWPKRS